MFGSRSAGEAAEEGKEREIFITKIVLDIVKPHNPSIIELAQGLGELRGVDRVDISVQDYDSNIERLKLTIEGEDLDYEEIARLVRYYGGNVASLDGVTALAREEE